MMIKLVQKRALMALRDGRLRLFQDMQNETGCTAGELLGLIDSGLARAADGDGTHIRITERGIEYLSLFGPFGTK